MHNLDRRTATALLVAGVFFMENLDATVITTALPAMARDFGTVATHLSMGVSAYLVALTVFIPVSGWATQRWGARRIFTTAIIIFTLSSLVCATSRSLGSFTLARIIQGLGGAMMVPVGRLVVLRDTPKEGMVKAIAILTWPALVAPILGPPVGGWLSIHWSWPWIFLLNLPLGVLAWIGALILIRNDETRHPPFDGLGFTLSGLGFGLFMSGMESASRGDVPRALTLGMLIIGIALVLILGWHLGKTKYPLFNLSPLRIATFRVTAVGGSLFRTAIGTAPFLLPLMFQLGFGMSAENAGMLLLWLFAGNLCMKPATTWVMHRYGFRRVLVVNGLLIAAGFCACAFLNATTPSWTIALLLFVTGMTRSMQFTAMNTVGFADVPQAQMRDASTLFSILQQMNAGMGIAVGALALALAESVNGRTAATVSTADFRLALLAIAAMALLAIVDSWLLPKDAGSAVLS